MKKAFYIISILLLMLAFTACASKPADTSSSVAAPTSPGNPEVGKELYAGTCIACHGEGGIGIEGLGKDMTASEFVADKTDAELIAFIKVGRDPSHPLNTTGVAMPPKGGNPALNDGDLNDIVAYVRTLQK